LSETAHQIFKKFHRDDLWGLPWKSCSKKFDSSKNMAAGARWTLHVYSFLPILWKLSKIFHIFCPILSKFAQCLYINEDTNPTKKWALLVHEVQNYLPLNWENGVYAIKSKFFIQFFPNLFIYQIKENKIFFIMVFLSWKSIKDKCY